MENTQEKVSENLGFSLVKFYCFLFLNKKKELISFFLITFILPLLPYLLVSYKLFNQSDSHQRAYYGDGSMLTLCAGILCSYFVILFEFKSENQKQTNSILNIVFVIGYVLMTFIFLECQLNFDRNWDFIHSIYIVSGILLLFTFLSAAYLNFEKNCDYKEMYDFFQERNRLKMTKKSKTLTKTEDNIIL